MPCGFLVFTLEPELPCWTAWTSHCSRFSCCKAQALGTAGQCLPTGACSCGSPPRAQAQMLQRLVAPKAYGISWTREQTHAPALAGGFLTTKPPEGPSIYHIIGHFFLPIYSHDVNANITSLFKIF